VLKTLVRWLLFWRRPPKEARAVVASGTRGPMSAAQRDALIDAVRDTHFRQETRERSHARAGESLGLRPDHAPAMVDLVFGGPGEPRLPDELFNRLRWGGQFVYTDAHVGRLRRLAEAYDDRRGFLLETRPREIGKGRVPLIGGGATEGFYFVARKTQLIQPGDFTERFTYDVSLVPDPSAPHGYVVLKRVPDHAQLIGRLRKKFPQVDEADLHKRAHKLIDHIFPTFLTREAAILKILAKHLPNEFKHRVPSLLTTEKDGDGFVRSLMMNWLRTGGPQLSQLEFARQSAELLEAVHDAAQVMHLDLRLDNFVITPDGVCFVDFGSAVRIGEELKQSPMLTTLFSEMMRTSHIQRMLGKMIETGQVTNTQMAGVHGKVDKTVDAFYLAVQIHRPRGNPELTPLIQHDPESDQARALSALTAAILRPKNPDKAHFKTASDILRGIRRIEQRFEETGSAMPEPAPIAA